jgi:hypothetical protein
VISTSEGELDLEDAVIQSVRRDEHGLRLDIHGVRLWLDGKAAEVPAIGLLLTGLVGEHSAFYVGAGVTAPVRDPSFPLDRIEVVEYKGDVLELQGYKGTEPWYTWRFSGANISVDLCGHEPSFT